jgi:hypothetical protein
MICSALSLFGCADQPSPQRAKRMDANGDFEIAPKDDMNVAVSGAVSFQDGTPPNATIEFHRGSDNRRIRAEIRDGEFSLPEGALPAGEYSVRIEASESPVRAEEKRPEKPFGGNHLRLFNTRIFGKSTSDPVQLLQPVLPGQIAPETVMVDIDEGKYFAATLRYPKTISFNAARKSLNTVYEKYEKESFANDPDMGLWRNEDEKFSIQLTEDENSLTVIYISFSPFHRERTLRALEQVISENENDENTSVLESVREFVEEFQEEN